MVIEKEYVCSNCGLQFTSKEAINKNYECCKYISGTDDFIQTIKLKDTSKYIVKNNTSVNEDENGVCYYCGESHLGLTCPDSEEATSGEY